MCTDASDFGFGAHLSSVLPSELVSGAWDPFDAHTHITYKELKAIRLALELLSHKLASKHLVVFSDSATIVAILQKYYTKSVKLRSLLGKVINLLNSLGTTLTVLHIDGVANVLADMLSRTIH